MYFIRQLLQGQWARTQQNLQNECMVKTDQIARIRRLMSIFASFLHITFIGFMYFKVIIIMSSSSSRQTATATIVVIATAEAAVVVVEVVVEVVVVAVVVVLAVVVAVVISSCR